ncbi:MAG: VOC family protein [Algoriphagus sp.]|nr:VOC family protein [Algoriphagus sp.]
MAKLNKVHHIAIICSDYEVSKAFYTGILGLKLEQEIYRKERESYKADLSLNGEYILELFSFPSPPSRPSRPEATGLRHLAFEVDDIQTEVEELNRLGVTTEPIRTDEFTGKKFTFFSDPDYLPIELYEK